MNEIDIKRALDRLANLRAEQDVIQLQKQELINSVLTQEVKDKLAEIDAEFEDKVAPVNAWIVGLESEIKQQVVDYGASVKATFLHAVWNKGRVSWDTKSLDGYAVAHPEILSLRKEGQPSVSIRIIP